MFVAAHTMKHVNLTAEPLFFVLHQLLQYIVMLISLFLVFSFTFFVRPLW